MPYRWTTTETPAGRKSHLRLWPHQSLGPRGFVAFFAITAVLVAVPLVAVVGSAILWGLLPFVALTFWAMWVALTRNQRDSARLTEELILTPGRITLHHQPARGAAKEWEANPHWVRLALLHEGGPVPDYLTLKGNGREVELGAFLSEAERRALYAELGERLAEAAR